MKKIFSAFLASFLLLGILCGCSKSDNNDKFTVYTTIYPIYDFACKIGGDKADVYSIIPQGTEPHDWEPTGNDVVNLINADVFLYNGLGLESWIDDVKSNLENTDVVCVSDGVTPITNQTASDPHIWLDPISAQIMLENIKNAFINSDAINAEYYKSNYEKYKTELESLDSEYKDSLLDCTQKNIITVHRAFGYLCSRYGLNQITAEGAVAESEPEAKVLVEIIETAKREGIKTVFVAEEGSSKIADTIASEIGGEVKTLYNLENLTDEQQENSSDYFSVMRLNLETLKEVLK